MRPPLPARPPRPAVPGTGVGRHRGGAGGGPAGMVAGLLFARAGLRVTMLEKHGDFLRDFRGDTVHPSTLRLFHEMGLLEKLLQRPHDKVHRLGGFIGDGAVIDPQFNTTDVAVVVQTDLMTDKYYKHYERQTREMPN